MEEVKAWTAAHATSEDWRGQLRALHQFSDRWRNAGHLSEKAFAEMQGQWKGVIKAAAARLEASVAGDAGGAVGAGVTVQWLRSPPRP